MTNPKGVDQPTGAKQNPSPDARAVLEFHRNDDLNARPESHHHDLGKGRSQASEGGHIHDGTTSNALLSATITGSRANNAASIMDQLLTELQKIGLTNGTTP